MTAGPQIKDRFQLDGKVALITGASRGIGEAIARGMAEFGASVVLSGRNLEGVEKVAAQLRAAGGRACTKWMRCPSRPTVACDSSFRRRSCARQSKPSAQWAARPSR